MSDMWGTTQEIRVGPTRDDVAGMGGSAAWCSSRDEVEGSAACGPGVYVWLQVGPDGGDVDRSTRPLPPRHPLLQGAATYAARPKGQKWPPPRMWFSVSRQINCKEQLLR
jgi:hypothetical protein